jgi:hypothetical protein
MMLRFMMRLCFERMYGLFVRAQRKEAQRSFLGFGIVEFVGRIMRF